MAVWQIWCILGVVLLIIEMLTPSMFFLNLSIAAFITAIAAYFISSPILHVILFGILSTLLIAFLRPLLLNKIKTNVPIEDMNEYIDKEATVIHPVSKTDGRVSIYGEEWNARSINEETIEPGSKVKIVKNDSLILYVERVKE